MEMVVIVKEENEIPANWKTAEECRAIAEDWSNEEIKKCVDKLMTEIVAKSNAGGVEARLPVRGGRPTHFYKTLEQVLTSLGFKVYSPKYPWEGDKKSWFISW
ncbi:MAG: hypothetical protein J6R67_03735 [Treponema sp.]|nr:hypothetical protein [Treponema sp.]